MTTTITQPCHVDDMPEHIYHSDPVPAGSLSASMAKLLIQPGGPAKLRHQLDNPAPPRKTFDLGHAAHQLILGKGAPIARIPNDYLAANGAASTSQARDFVEHARQAGKVPLKPDEYDTVMKMAARILGNPDAMAALHSTGAEHEVSGFAVDDTTGVWLRCRFDSIAPSGIADYKTSVSADPALFARRTMLDLGYHIQAAHYHDMAATLGLCPASAPFRFVVQEKTAPYLVSVITVGDDYLELGRAAMRRAINLWAECSRTGLWPGYPSSIAEPPAWALTELATELDPAIEAELTALLGRNPS